MPKRSAARARARAPLSRERALDVAMTLADADGLDQLTMRRLAEALQVEAQAVQSQVNRLLHHPLEGVLPLLVPLITAAISHLRKPAAAAE